MRSLGNRVRAALKAVHAFMTVPMYAALLSIFVAMIPPLQEWISRIKPFREAVKGAGQCSSELALTVELTNSVPVTLVVLGAFFYSPPAPAPAIALPIHDDENVQPKSHGLGGYIHKIQCLAHGSEKSAAYPGENKAVFVAVMSRMIIVPAIMVPVIGLLAKLDPFVAAEDPVFILSAVLLVSSVCRLSNTSGCADLRAASRLDARANYTGRFGRRV